MFAQQEDLTGLVGWVADVIAALGSPGVGLLIALENLFPPLPSEAVLPLAGYLASQDRLSLWGAVVFSTLGSVLGALALYVLGRLLGRNRIARLLGPIPLVEAEDLDQAWEWWDRHGGKAVLIGRVVPLVRSFVSIPAGVERMPLLPFLGLTALGSLVWNVALIGAGWLLGDQWEDVGSYSDYLNYGVVLAILALLARFVWKRRHRIRRFADR